MHDEFFHLARKLEQDVLIERIRLLEKINGAEYSSEAKRIRKFYADGRIAPGEESQIEKIIPIPILNGLKRDGRYSGRPIGL